MVTIEGPHIRSSPALWQGDGSGMLLLFHAQKSPVLTLGLGHSSGASCSGNALRGALSAHTIVHFRLYAIFLHAP